MSYAYGRRRYLHSFPTRRSSDLEQAGLVTTEKVGRVRHCKLGPHRLKDETAWLERYRRRWDERFDALDTVVEELTRKERDRKSTRLNSSHLVISYAVFCLKKKNH